jgi:hypothetical protein
LLLYKEKNKLKKRKDMISTLDILKNTFSTTINKNYFVIDSGKINKNKISELISLLRFLENSNVVLDSSAINALLSTTDEVFDFIDDSLRRKFMEVHGEFFRNSFATSSVLKDEAMTLDEYYKQITAYVLRYSLGELPHEYFGEEDRKVDISNITNEDEIKNLNKNLKIITAKSQEEFINDIKNIIESPIVYGEQQRDFLEAANDSNILDVVLEYNLNFKVKENLFGLIDIIGKDKFKTLNNTNPLNTVKDVLRYAYFVSGEDYAELKKGIKFNISTSDKKFIMKSLDTICERDFTRAVSDAKPLKSNLLGLSRNLYPGSKKYSKYSNAQAFFDVLRNIKKIITRGTYINNYISENDYVSLIELLSDNQGELLRSIDMILRKANDEEIEYLVHKLSTLELNPKLVLQVRSWIKYRKNNKLDKRVVIVKTKPYIIQKEVEGLEEKRVKKISKVLKKSLRNSLKDKELFNFKKDK